MKKFVVLAALLLLAAPAIAQNSKPTEIIAKDTIELQPGEARVFNFDRAIGGIALTLDGVVQVVPNSDRVFTFRALRAGTVLMTASAPDGATVYQANILVGGRTVKMYGTEPRRAQQQQRSARRQGSDYVGYLCTSTGCGRANPDIPDAPSGVTISDSRANPDGTTTITTQEFR